MAAIRAEIEFPAKVEPNSKASEDRLVDAVNENGPFCAGHRIGDVFKGR